MAKPEKKLEEQGADRTAQSPYKRRYYEWPLNRMAKTLKERLRLDGDPIAVAWSMEPPPRTVPYKGGLKMMHCQFMQRSRFLGETFVLSLENIDQKCNGFSYIGLAEPSPNLKTGYAHSRRPDGKASIFGSPGASRRVLLTYHWIEPNTVSYFSCAPLSNCHFDPDVVVIISEPRTAMYAVRAAIHYRGGNATGETGPGTCSVSWIAAYLTGEIKYSLGCRGVFGLMGIDPKEVCVSFPIEGLPEVCANLEEWRENNYLTFNEGPPNREKPWMKVPYDGSYENPPLGQ